MAEIRRTAQAFWTGDLRGGRGQLGTGSGALDGEVYTFGTRFEDAPGTNPEELMAAAHAACYSMAFAHTLSTHGYEPETIETDATATLTRQPKGGFRISNMRLDVRAKVPGVDESTLRELSNEAHEGCPVSNALRGGPNIEIVVSLL